MSSYSESWKRTRAHLHRAHTSVGAPPLEAYREYLDHNELELAADVLAEYGEERGAASNAFFEALADAYDEMGLSETAERYRARVRSA